VFEVKKMGTKRKPIIFVKRLSKSLLALILVLALLGPVPGLLAGNMNLPGNFIPAAAAADPVIAAAGDIACDPATTAFNGGLGTSSSCRDEYTSNLLVNGGFAAVLSLGDNQYYCGGYQAFLQSYDPSWGRVKAITHPVVARVVMRPIPARRVIFNILVRLPARPDRVITVLMSEPGT
jgi:hypothetical protein